MQKRFIAVSTAVAALAFVLSFSTSSARADSIHSQDLKFDSFTPFANSCDLSCVLDSAFAADRGQIFVLFSDKHGDFRENALTGWEKEIAVEGLFGFPIASHIEHREGNGNPRSTAVPEPGSLLLAGFGLTGLFLLRKSRRPSPPFPPAAV